MNEDRHRGPSLRVMAAGRAKDVAQVLGGSSTSKTRMAAGRAKDVADGNDEAAVGR